MAQVLDVAVDGAVRDDAMIGIQTIEQLVARPNLVGSLSRHAQQAKLCGCQWQRDPVERCLVALAVDDETRMRCCRFSAARPPQDRVDASDQLTRAEWLQM